VLLLLSLSLLLLFLMNVFVWRYLKGLAVPRGVGSQTNSELAGPPTIASFWTAACLSGGGGLVCYYTSREHPRVAPLSSHFLVFIHLLWLNITFSPAAAATARIKNAGAQPGMIC